MTITQFHLTNETAQGISREKHGEFLDFTSAFSFTIAGCRGRGTAAPHSSERYNLAVYDVPSKAAEALPAQGMNSDPRWQLIERILRTNPFQKSSNLRGLLSYLAEHSLSEQHEALTERQIGIAVFGKADYSPAEDSAVRVHARRLRLRLHERWFR